MNVQVRHRFAGVRAVVHHQPEALREREFFCHDSSNEQQMSEHGLIGGRGVADARDDFLRDDQKVNRCLGLNVMEDDAVFVLVLDLGRDFASS